MEPKPPSSAGTEQVRKLDELIRMVRDTATAKAWESKVVGTDEKNGRYATVSVSRITPGSYLPVTAVVEITCDEQTSISYTQTSAFSHGLSDLYSAIGNEFSKIPWLTPIPKQASSSKIGVFVVERVLRRFHRIARELKHRHNNRPEFPVADEYDVQDLLRAILVGLFDDVRPEEYAPTYAGGASRMDFLIKAERLVVETKFASASLKDKQLGEQLIVDTERYQSHPDCQRLVCFVYDPSGYVKNPSGLESDLSGKHGEIEVNVVVVSP